MIPKYTIFTLELSGPSCGNPYTEVDLRATFRYMNLKKVVSGFYDGDGKYIIRFMPDLEGEWEYTTESNVPALDGKTGTFLCTPAAADNHGPVRVHNRFHFAYDDGTPFYPFGTTAYNWVNQEPAIVEQTIRTLSENKFNKIRMGTFPKHYLHNLNEPPMYPFAGGFAEEPADGPEGQNRYSFDFTKPNFAWWHHFERCVQEMDRLGIEVDLIVFHPYDRWGFSDMGKENNLRYIRYLVARLGAYKNIWWSMANEYDLFPTWTIEDWEDYAGEVVLWDASDHLRSIHNCHDFYDHSRGWITHVSLQRQSWHSHAELVAEWRERWGKPVVVDEICYEGNIETGWGNITGQELTKRFWDVVIRGGYCTHGETFLREDDILWWAKGGWLTGESPARIAFCRKIVEEMGQLDPREKTDFDLWWAISGKRIKTEIQSYSGKKTVTMAEKMICYFSFSQPALRKFTLPADVRYTIDVIDTWDMTVTRLDGEYSGQFEIPLPGKPYIAVRFCAV